MPNQLVDLELGGLELLSVVDKGASGNADIRPRIVLLKRNNKGAVMGLFDRIRKNVNQTLDATLAEETASAGPFDINKALDELGLTPEQREAVTKADNPQAAMIEALEQLGLRPEQLAMLKALFMQALHAAPPPQPPEAAAPVEVIEKPEDEDEPKKPEMKDVELEEKKKTEAMAVSKQLESLPEDVRKQFEQMQQRTEELETQQAEDIAKRELADQLEVAKRFPHVSGDLDERAALLLSIQKNQGDAAYTKVIKVYEEAERIAGGATGRFQGLGTTRTDGLGDPEGEFDAEVVKIQKADGCSRQQAFKRAKQRNPELYAATKAVD